ncbi:MAG TPA: GNAT family N-acetyltransferase [Planctomycetota bacterium]
MTRAAVTVRPVRPSDWEALAELFGARGACAGCWCMAWRLPRARWEAGRGAGNRRALRRLVTSGTPPGVLAFAGERAVGWCSVAPRAEFAALAKKPSLATDWDARTWSVTCFFVAKDWRKRGLGRRLLDAAVRLARAGGATRVEGYPAPPPKQGGDLPAVFAWTGLPAVFERCGFAPRTDVPGKRPIYVRALRRS